MAKPATSKTSIDMNKFRLRTFVDKLIDIGEVEIHDEAVPLSELSRIIEATPKAVLFRKAGPEQVELVSSVAGGPRRFQTVREAVAAGPIYFVDIMRGLGSEDGREIALELDALRQEGVLCRNGDGQYFLGASKKGVTTVVAE